MTATADALAAAAVAAFGDDAARVLARIGGADGQVAARRLAELAAIADAGARRRLRATWAAAVRAPVPAGIRGVHASWIEDALRDEPAGARAALATGGGEGGGTSVWLARRVCARFPAMPAVRARGATASVASVASVDDAIACDADALAAWLAELGADQLAIAVGADGADAIVAGAGDAADRDRLRSAVARVLLAPRLGALGGARAAIARCRGVTLGAPAALLRIGARAIAPHVAGDPTRIAQLGVRLPRALGAIVIAELVAHADDPIARAPTWAALSAA